MGKHAERIQYSESTIASQGTTGNIEDRCWAQIAGINYKSPACDFKASRKQRTRGGNSEGSRPGLAYNLTAGNCAIERAAVGELNRESLTGLQRDSTQICHACERYRTGGIEYCKVCQCHRIPKHGGVRVENFDTYRTA